MVYVIVIHPSRVGGVVLAHADADGAVGRARQHDVGP